jgi:hypothetical protein
MRQPPSPVGPPDESLLRLIEAEERAAAILREAEAEAVRVLDAARTAAAKLEAEAEAEIAAAVARLEAQVAAERAAALAALAREFAEPPAGCSEADLSRLVERILALLLEAPGEAPGGTSP